MTQGQPNSNCPVTAAHPLARLAHGEAVGLSSGDDELLVTLLPTA